jgi:hypothetical protein
MSEPIDCPVAPGPFHEEDQDEYTPAQRRCAQIPDAECAKHERCLGCPAYVPPSWGSRA